MTLSGKTVILDNLRSAHNTGSIYRTAYITGFSNVIHVGITPNTGNPRFTEASRGTEEHINTYRCDSIEQAIDMCRQAGMSIIALEKCKDGVEPEFLKAEGDYAVILGNEALGVSEYAMEHSDQIITIKSREDKSFNVSIAFSIFAYIASKGNLT